MAERLTLRCATESLAREEPMAGTASRVQRWLIVEQPGAWGRDAVRTSGLDATVAEALEAHAAGHRVRALVARRTGDRRRSGDRTVFLAHSGVERAWLEQLTLPADRPDTLLDIDLGVTAFPDPPGLGRPGPPTLHMVCTNGRHDPCCADRGRPVVRALVEAHAPDVWEVSHVGGDRFAANIVCLPDGTYYGRVQPDEAAALLAEHRAGLIALDRYRGRSCHPPAVQVAEWHARRHLGERRLDGITVVSTEPGPGEGTVVVVLEPRGRGDALAVVLRRERAAPAQLTCHVHRESQPWAYRMVDLHPA